MQIFPINFHTDIQSDYKMHIVILNYILVASQQRREAWYFTDPCVVSLIPTASYVYKFQANFQRHKASVN